MGRLFPQTFAGAVYNVCIRGCKRYPWRTHVFAFKVDQIGPGGCSALQGWMQCTAGAVAVHCGDGCSALRLRWVKLAPKWPVLFWIRDKGGETHLIRVSVAPQIYLVIQRKWLSGGWVCAIQGARHLHFEPCPSSIFITLMTD